MHTRGDIKIQVPTEMIEDIVIHMPSTLTNTTILLPSGFSTHKINDCDIASSLPITLNNGILTSSNDSSTSVRFTPNDLTMCTTTFDYTVTNATGTETTIKFIIFSGASGFKENGVDLADIYVHSITGSSMGVSTNYLSNEIDIGSIFEAKDSPITTGKGKSSYKVNIGGGDGTPYKFDEYFKPLSSLCCVY